MATPMLLMAADKPNTAQETTKPETTKTRGRKSAGKGPNQKKQPQRGLGVAQLERLRLQERWKKMTELPQPHHFQCQAPLLMEPPFGNVPVQFAAASYGGGPPVVDDCGGGFLGFDHAGLVVQRMGNGGFIGGGGGGPSGVGGLMMVEPYPHGCGAVDPRLLVGSGMEASRELSSIPKMPPPCVSDRCDICFKKKRVNFSNGVKQKNIAAETPAAEAINTGFDFLGLSIEHRPPNSAGELSSSAGRGGATPADHYTGFNINQGGAEIKQIHRKLGKGGEGGGGGSLLMEYEFFPRKSSRGTEFKEVEMPKEEASIAEVVDGEASCITTSCTAINGGISSSSAVDLSLKLSF